MIRDTRDLVRYSTDVGVADNGRHLKGFAMRGVEGNRVDVSIDGVSLPDFEENSLYNRYGNFNNSRLSIDPELVRSIDIVKVSDSVNAGSGSLGGGVNYRTLGAQDIVQADKEFGGILRSGHATKNREWVNTLGFGVVKSQFDAALLYSHRRGHEIKSKGSGPNTLGSSSQNPDPAQHRFHSYLGKFNWRFHPDHKLGFSITGQDGSRYTDERSYQLIGSLWREAEDDSKRMNINSHHEWTPGSRYLSLLRSDFDYQKTDLASVNYKGSRPLNFITNTYGEKELDEIYDRRMRTNYKRFSLLLEGQPFRLGGEHTLSFKAFSADKTFQNINYDTIGVGKDYRTTTRYAIQYPVKTRQYGFLLKDRTVWNPTFSSQIGVRYDYEQLKPKDLNAPCSSACKAEGKPNKNTFVNWNGFVGLDANINPTWKTGYLFSTGHRVPTASEMYFTFDSPYGKWQSNPNLKAERSFSHSLSLQGRNEKGLLDFTLYQTRYRNFLVEQENIISTPNPYYDQCALYGCSRYFQTPKQQMVNLDKGRIQGVEIKGRLNAHHFLPVAEGWKLHGALGYSKGKISGDNSLLSIQPLKIITGLDYERPDGKWGVFSRMTYLGKKKTSDAKVTQITGTRSNLKKEIIAYPYLNSSATVFDIFGYYRPFKNFTARAGVYNVFDRKYHTWDALRGINANSTTNTVDRDGVGLERFHAPGRNFAFSLEYKF